MPTLRDHTREALSSTEPGPREGREELDQILRRSRAERPLGWKLALVPAVAVAAAVVVWIAIGRRPAPVARTTPPPAGIHLYVRSSGEPESSALSLDLATQGDR
ncbi:MAG: hypothetical protein JNL38_03240 [Myxococcales bacterium]|nr:hypothetical protein [Myxococcales bacterium]